MQAATAQMQTKADSDDDVRLPQRKQSPPTLTATEQDTVEEYGVWVGPSKERWKCQKPRCTKSHRASIGDCENCFTKCPPR